MCIRDRTSVRSLLLPQDYIMWEAVHPNSRQGWKDSRRRWDPSFRQENLRWEAALTAKEEHLPDRREARCLLCSQGHRPVMWKNSLLRFLISLKNKKRQTECRIIIKCDNCTAFFFSENPGPFCWERWPPDFCVSGKRSHFISECRNIIQIIRHHLTNFQAGEGYNF